MILPSPDRLNRFNKYALVVLAAKRARQLQEQGIARRALVKSASSNPLTVALEEIAGGRLVPSFTPEPLPELMEPEVVEPILTPEEFEEARAKVLFLESAEDLSDNDVEERVDEEAIVDEVDAALGLDEEEDIAGNGYVVQGIEDSDTFSDDVEVVEVRPVEESAQPLSTEAVDVSAAQLEEGSSPLGEEEGDPSESEQEAAAPKDEA